MQRNSLGFARIQRETIKRYECSGSELNALWFIGRSAEVGLRDFVSARGAGVLHFDGQVYATVAGCVRGEIGELEFGVGESEAEGIERSDILIVEPAVANENAFREGRLASDARARTLWMGWRCGGVVGERSGPGDWQLAAGVVESEKRFGFRNAAFVAGPPHFDDPFHLVDPRHGDGLASVEDDDGVGIDSGDLFDKLVLITGQFKVRFVARPHEDDGGVCVFCRSEGVAMGLLARLGSHPVEANLYGSVGGIDGGDNFDGVFAGG